MARRFLTKRSKMLLIISIVFGVLIIGGSGYLLWRVNQEDKLSSEDAAAGCLDKDGNLLSGCIRCQCEDGAWVAGKDPNGCYSLCGTMGHNKPKSTSSGSSCIQGSQCPACEWPSVAYCGCSGDSNPAPNKCGCRKYNDFTCGVPCGTVQSCTPSSCPSGWTNCGISGSSGASGSGCVAKTSCKGKCLGCTNEFIVKRYCRPASQNTCDGGDWTKRLPDQIQEGESIEFSGYGEDTDGVDPTSIEIEVNGTPIDSVNATVNALDSDKTNWSHTLTGLEAGEHTVTISWKDTKGLGGSNCTLTDTLTVQEVQTNPDWNISKTGVPVCVEGAEDALDKVQVAYTITITNTGDGEGFISNIVDTLDGKVEETFVVNGEIIPTGEYSGGKITWSMSGEDSSFDPGESKTYKYKISIPRENFGTYGNTVVATPTEGDSFSAKADIVADCSLIEEVPDTGIIDDAYRNILVGFGFLTLGMLYMKFDFVKLAWNGIEQGKERTKKRKSKKTGILREKFENRFRKRI